MTIVIVTVLVIGLFVMAVMGMSRDDHKAKPNAENKGSHPGEYYHQYAQYAAQYKMHSDWVDAEIRLKEWREKRAQKYRAQNRQKSTRGARLYPVR